MLEQDGGALFAVGGGMNKTLRVGHKFNSKGQYMHGRWNRGKGGLGRCTTVVMAAMTRFILAASAF